MYPASLVGLIIFNLTLLLSFFSSNSDLSLSLLLSSLVNSQVLLKVSLYFLVLLYSISHFFACYTLLLVQG